EVDTTIAGVYDVTPDWHPVLGQWPGLDGLYLAVGFSGHALKLAPAVGEVIADELTGRTPAIDITELRPATAPRPLRFAYGPGAGAGPPVTWTQPAIARPPWTRTHPGTVRPPACCAKTGAEGSC